MKTFLIFIFILSDSVLAQTVICIFLLPFLRAVAQKSRFDLEITEPKSETSPPMPMPSVSQYPEIRDPAPL